MYPVAAEKVCALLIVLYRQSAEPPEQFLRFGRGGGRKTGGRVFFYKPEKIVERYSVLFGLYSRVNGGHIAPADSI